VFSVVRCNPFLNTTTVQFDNNDEFAGGGIDYNSGPYSVTFTAGQTSASFDVAINDDNILELSEDFTVTITTGTLPDGVTRDGDGQAIVVIMDDEGVHLLESLRVMLISVHFIYITCSHYISEIQNFD